MNEKITVLTVNWNSAELLEFMLASLFSKAEFPENLSVIVIDNTNGSDSGLSLLKKKFSGIEIFPYDPGNAKGLYAHAAALNFGFTKIRTPFFLTADPDIFLFKKKWDTFCLNLIEEKKADAAGTQYPEWWLGTYHNFPSPVFCFGKTDAFKILGPDWTPFKSSAVMRIINFFLRQIVRGFFLFRRKNMNKYRTLRKSVMKLAGFYPLCSFDTGSAMALNQEKMKKFSSELFNAVYPDSLNKNSEALTLLAEYFEIYFYGNELILTHQYGSQNFFLKTDKGNDTHYWKNLIAQIEEKDNG
jgi:hypothetical protein